ncbi:MAG: pitrilysin family protein [Pseudomonadota bacterium]|nr:pitrilysin family protein [Pseudomonadota bacterium]
MLDLPDLRRAALALAAALLVTGCAPFSPAAPVAPEVSTPQAAPVAQITNAAATAAGVHSSTLPNGLTLIVKPDRRAPTAVHMLWVRVGSVDEVGGTTGVAHLLEHLMFKGTETLAPGEFSRRVAALGGQENAFTSLDYTGYYQQVPAARLADVMALEADRFAHNRYSDEEFAKELAVVKEERRLRTDDNPRAVMAEQLRAAAFVASPYRQPVIGWMGDLDAMTAQDARDFYQRWYVPANAAVVVVGDVDPQAVRALAEQTYGRVPARAVPVRKPQPEPPQRGLRRIEVKAPAEQALVALSFRVPQLGSLDPSPANDDALALTVLAAVLDGYSGARLDRALTQGPGRVADSASAGNGLLGRGPQVFSLSGIPAQGKTAAQVEAALRAQVARVAKEGVSEVELARVKTQWVASQVYKRDSVMGQAQELGHWWVQGLPLDADERLITRLRSVTAAQVQAVAQRYFGDDQLTVATLVPQPRDPAQAPRTPPAGTRH